MYDWRKLTPEQREELLHARKSAALPWHSPPHRIEAGTHQYMLSAACYEHAPIVGCAPERMDAFSQDLLAAVRPGCEEIFAWCVLPNHYHVVVQSAAVGTALAALAQLHGRTSYLWNGEDARRGRKVWFGVSDRQQRSEAHLWASINYVHNNPVKHGYAARWQDWPWSSARSFLEEVGLEQARSFWQTYPVLDYGKGWDD